MAKGEVFMSIQLIDTDTLHRDLRDRIPLVEIGKKRLVAFVENVHIGSLSDDVLYSIVERAPEKAIAFRIVTEGKPRDGRHGLECKYTIIYYDLPRK
jgi:hypothetical protein